MDYLNLRKKKWRRELPSRPRVALGGVILEASPLAVKLASAMHLMDTAVASTGW
jgi:hypothetical protein